MCTLYTYSNTCTPRFRSFGFFGPSRCLVPTPGLTSSTPCAVCVCVCVYTHIRPRILPPASKNRKDTDNTRISPCIKKNKPPRQATSALHRLATHFTRPQTPMNKLSIQERMCTPCSECGRKFVCWCQNTCLTYTPANALVLNTTVLVHATQLSQTIWSLVQASCRLLFAARPFVGFDASIARRCSLEKIIQIHASSYCGRGCVVGQASSDHPRWCGPHPAGLCFALTLGRGPHSRQNLILALDLAGFSPTS